MDKTPRGTIPPPAFHGILQTLLLLAGGGEKPTEIYYTFKGTTYRGNLRTRHPCIHPEKLGTTQGYVLQAASKTDARLIIPRWPWSQRCCDLGHSHRQMTTTHTATSRNPDNGINTTTRYSDKPENPRNPNHCCFYHH